MRKIIAIMWALAGWLTAADLYVTPRGDDAHAGTRAQPLASLAGARDAIRKMKRDGPLVVHLAAGRYGVSSAVEFGELDSGTAESPIIYQADRGGLVVITGGKEVNDWKPVTDAAVLAQLAEEVRGRVMVADLNAAGCTELGKLKPRGFGVGKPVAEAELFFDGQPMTLARWPNDGFRRAKSKQGDRLLVVDTDRMARWTAETDPWVFAYWNFDWAEVCEPLAGVDVKKNALLRTDQVKAVYGITPAHARWYVCNMLSEIDSPGEYFIDRVHAQIYFLPPHAGGRAVVSMADGLIRSNNLSHVAFRGFLIESCRGSAVEMHGGSDNQVIACTIRNTGLHGVSVTGGTRHQVVGCDVSFTGASGILMSGGDRATLTPASHLVENCHVHHFGRRIRTYEPGVGVSGVGNRVAHNLIHDGPHMALNASGNDHVIEFNEIHNVVEESGDAGAYYVGRDWTQRGNVLRYNYFHDILGATGYGGMTIYLDDQQCGHTIYGNLFERCMQSVFIGGGDDHTVSNNVFVDCVKSAHVDNRGIGWQKAATDDPKGELRTRLMAMPYTNDLWKSRYPTLVGVLDDEPGIPKRNVFTNNISAGGKWDDVHASIRQYQTIENNLVFDQDPSWVVVRKDAGGHPQSLQFKDDAAVKRIHFKPLPVREMGLVADSRRASWPVVRHVRPVVFSGNR